MNAGGIMPCATAHCDAQYSVASPPLYQSQPLCGVSNASQATTASCTSTSAASSGAGGALLNQAAARAALLRTRMLTRDVPIPGDRLLEPLTQRRASTEAEELLRACRVELSPRLAVRHRRVPHQLAVESRQLRDQLRQLADRRLDARAQVDRLDAVVPLGRQGQTLGCVVDVEELARRRPVAPQDHLAARVRHLADQRRDHVRRLEVEVVARAVEV